MGAIVYIWRNTPTDPGHASLESVGAYVSYWPQGEDTEAKNFVKNPPGKGAIKDFNVGATHKPYFPSNYRHDCKLERRECDIKVILNKLDEDVIEKSWNDFKKNPKRYNMLSHNCSTVVQHCLSLVLQSHHTIRRVLKLQNMLKIHTSYGISNYVLWVII